MVVEKLIAIVRERRELYDPRHEDYAKVKLKNRIWKEIAKELHYKDGEYICKHINKSNFYSFNMHSGKVLLKLFIKIPYSLILSVTKLLRFINNVSSGDCSAPSGQLDIIEQNKCK